MRDILCFGYTGCGQDWSSGEHKMTRRKKGWNDYYIYTFGLGTSTSLHAPDPKRPPRDRERSEETTEKIVVEDKQIDSWLLRGSTTSVWDMRNKTLLLQRSERETAKVKN